MADINDCKKVMQLIEELVKIHENALDNRQEIFKKYAPAENSNNIYSTLLQGHNSKMDSSQLLQELNTLIQDREKIQSDISLAMIYELLMVIFEATTREDRVYNFHKLTQSYYDSSKRKLAEVGVENSESFKKIVSKLLPFIKLDTINKFLKEQRKQTELKELSDELLEYFDHKEFLREDSYVIFENIRSVYNNYNKFVKFEFVPLDTRQGILGDYFKLRIYLKDSNQEETFHIFVKYIPKAVPEIFQHAAKFTFKKEQFLYGTLIPKLEEHGLGSISDFAAKCWMIKRDTYIAMEDLQVQKYITRKLDLVSDIDWLTFVVTNVAKIHSCSLILEEKWSDKASRTVRLNEEYGEFLQEVLFTKADESGKVQECSARMVRTFFVDQFPDIPKKVTVEQFKKYLETTYDRLCVNFAASGKYRNSICHGDLWPSNILYKSDEFLKTISCRFVDYQLLRYCPPILDVILFVYLVTDREFRGKHLSFLIDEYYKALAKNLAEHDVDVEEIYSRQLFMESLRELKVYGIWQAVCYGQVLYMNDLSSLASDSKEQNLFWTEDRSLVFEKAMEDPVYSKRMKELVQEIYDLSEEDILASIK